MWLEQTRDTARLGLIQKRHEHLRRIRFLSDHEHIDAATTGVEHVFGALTRHVHVGHQGRSRHTHAQLAHPLEIRAAVDV